MPTDVAPSSHAGIERAGVRDQIARHAGFVADLAQPVRVGAVRRADDQHDIDELAPARAPRAGGSASRSRCPCVSGPTIVGKRAFSASMTARVSSTLKRRLGDEGELVGVGDGEARRHPRRCEIRCTRPVDPAHRALDLGMAGMADQDDLAALVGVALALDMHLGDQRAGRVDHRQAALAGRRSRLRWRRRGR